MAERWRMLWRTEVGGFCGKVFCFALIGVIKLSHQVTLNAKRSWRQGF